MTVLKQIRLLFAQFYKRRNKHFEDIINWLLKSNIAYVANGDLSFLENIE
jgi:hypothetical protein